MHDDPDGGPGSSPDQGRTDLPARSRFPALEGTYLNAASVHPMIDAAVGALEKYARARGRAAGAVDSLEVRSLFARLIGAEPGEISLVPSTMIGEYFVTRALGLPERGGRVVTDALHFSGSHYLYDRYREEGMEVVVLPIDSEGRVPIDSFEEAIRPGTTLVSVSSVSFVNGYVHDLAAISEIAHGRGALVYADLIQAAGALPVDVRADGVDFAACGSYKWLMGDFGLGFLFVRDGALDRLVRRPWIGYRQAEDFFDPPSYLFPYDPSGDRPYEFVVRDDQGGWFNGAFPARTVEAALHPSLEWLLEVGPRRIQEYRQPLVDRIQEELRARGFHPLTPRDTVSGIVSFAHPHPGPLSARLADAGITISSTGNRFRISPSVYNDMDDVEHLLAAIGEPGAPAGGGPAR